MIFSLNYVGRALYFPKYTDFEERKKLFHDLNWLDILELLKHTG